MFECKKIVFPVGENNYHFVFFVVDPNTLTQELYDSLHAGLDSEDKRTFRSRCTSG